MAVTPVLDGDELVVTGLGRRTRTNAEARPAVAFVWPPRDEADYSLIVDGRAAIDGETMRVRLKRAVMHRPASPGKAVVEGACGADCVEIMPAR